MNKLVNLITSVALFLLLGIGLVSCSGGGSGTVGSSGDSGIGGGGSGTVGSSGDSGIGGGNTGTLILGLTDGPPPKNTYDAIYVTIKEISVKHEDKEGWDRLTGPELDLPKTFNLLDLVNGVIADLGVVELEAGHYNQMRLLLGTEPDEEENILGEAHDYANYLILEGDDEQIPLKVPSGYQTGIKLVNGFDIEVEGSTELVLDFDANKSIVKAGKSGKWLLKPTIKMIESVTYSVEGFVEDNEDNRLAEADVSAQIYDSAALDPKDEITVAASAKSNDNGYYFMYLSLYQEKYNIVATKDGYLPACKVLDSDGLIAGYIRDFNLTPAAATGTFTGSARGLESPEDTALFSIRQVDASCGMIEVASRSAVNTTAEPADYFDPITLPVGTYEVVVSAEGEETQVWSIEVTADTETVLDVFYSAPSFNCDITEREALMALYTSTDGDYWLDNTGWGIGEPCDGDSSSWYGITCQDSKITNIDLEENNLVGTIPPEIGCMSDLLDLRLHRNSLTGVIPGEIGNLSTLQYLNLAVNGFTGSLPSQIGDLTNLEYLHLYQNSFIGNIPPQIGDLTQLRELLLGANQLEGNIPPEIGQLTNLRTLNLHANQLEGFIPAEIWDLTNLEFLSLAANQLEGIIPAAIGNLTGLQYLLLQDNNLLSGTIPSEIWSLTSLVDLQLHNNSFTGRIPRQIGNLTNLEYLNLGANQLSGPIPAEIGNVGFDGTVDHLQNLYLYQNGFTGNIPQEIGELTELRELLLGANELTGNIPWQLGNLSNLQILNLHDNQLFGSIPLTFSNLTALDTFDVSGNCLIDFEPVSHVPNLIGADSQNDNCGI